MSLEERRRQLKTEFSKGIENRARIDALLHTENASLEDDLRAMLALSDTDALRLLDAKLRRGDVIRQAYRGPHGTGCLTYFFLGFESNDDLLQYPYESTEILDSTCRCVRAWDYGDLSVPTALHVVRETIRERNRLNTREDKVRQNCLLESPACG